ncbi:MAG: hypothetical protein RMK94_14880 [Armatimonadota bacterium]|nr:hypothetical protein [Armatimonadota bacterium]
MTFLQSLKFLRSLLQSLLVLYVHAAGFSQRLMTNLRAPNLFGEKIPPSKDGAQEIRQRLWAKAHSMFA